MFISRLSKHFKVHQDDFRTASKPEPESLTQGEAAVAGAVGGATAGAVIGASAGYISALDDLRNPQVTVSDETYFSTRPEVVGAHYDDADLMTRYNPTTETTETYWTDDDWDPIIERHRVKAYQEPVFETEQAGMVRQVAGGALKGAAIGAVVGAAGMTAARATGVEVVKPKDILEDTQTAMIAGGAGGTVIGGIAGFHAGKVAQANAQVEVRTAPVYERQHVGWMPLERNARQISRDLNKGSGNYRISYEEIGDRYGNPPFQGQDAVYSNVPVGEQQKEYLSSTLTPLKGAAVGAVTGGVLGVAVGTAASVLTRMVTAKD